MGRLIPWVMGLSKYFVGGAVGLAGTVAAVPGISWVDTKFFNGTLGRGLKKGAHDAVDGVLDLEAFGKGRNNNLQGFLDGGAVMSRLAGMVAVAARFLGFEDFAKGLESKYVANIQTIEQLQGKVNAPRQNGPGTGEPTGNGIQLTPEGKAALRDARKEISTTAKDVGAESLTVAKGLGNATQSVLQESVQIAKGLGNAAIDTTVGLVAPLTAVAGISKLATGSWNPLKFISPGTTSGGGSSPTPPPTSGGNGSRGASLSNAGQAATETTRSGSRADAINEAKREIERANRGTSTTHAEPASRPSVPATGPRIRAFGRASAVTALTGAAIVAASNAAQGATLKDAATEGLKSLPLVDGVGKMASGDTVGGLRSMAKDAGSLGGAVVGASAGATVGSVVPVVGTFIGGVAGGIAGAIGGDAAVDGILNTADYVKNGLSSLFATKAKEVSPVSVAVTTPTATRFNSAVRNDIIPEMPSLRGMPEPVPGWSPIM